MVLELVASRLIARHLGSSLYTWTSVIGVVLSGITFGNWMGGRVADRYPARRTLGALFLVASVACVSIIVLNSLVGEWAWLWRLSWPNRVFLHIFLVFLVPSTLLGMISPVVAKMALDTGLPTGRTVGDIYAWGAAGSIVGTFATGYLLVSLLGSIAIIWTVAAVLLVLGLFFSSGNWPARLWMFCFLFLATLAWAPWPWAWALGNTMNLRQDAEPGIIYAKDTPYCYVTVKRTSAEPEIFSFYQDKLLHSSLIAGEIDDLQYHYEKIYAALTQRHARNKESFRSLFIGGGGYVFPRYIQQLAPQSQVDVVEIDPGVTEAAMAAFGLPRDTPIKTFNLDARNYVDGLLESRQASTPGPRYDFIYEDAFNDYLIPYQLTTKEFNDKISEILTEDGLYLVNLIDIPASGLFLGSYLHTLEQTFPHVEILQEEGLATSRKTFVVVASRSEVLVQDLHLEPATRDLRLEVMTEQEKETLRKRSGYRLLTDDWAPVDHMMAPVALRAAKDVLGERIEQQAIELLQAERYDESIEKYLELMELNPALWTLKASSQIGFIQSVKGNFLEGVVSYRTALDFNERAEFKEDVHMIHLRLGRLLDRLGHIEEAREQMNLALPGLSHAAQMQPESLAAIELLGDTCASLGRWRDAEHAYMKALALAPGKIPNYFKISQSLELQGQVEEAFAVVDRLSALLAREGRDEELPLVQRYWQSIEARQARAENSPPPSSG